MSPEFTLTLNVAEIFALCGVVWGLAKMSKSVDVLADVTTKIIASLEGVNKTLGDMEGRLRVLEDRWFRWAKS